MKNYDHIRKICQEHSHLSVPVIDDFLIYFAAAQNKLDRKYDQKIATFRHITRDHPREWVNKLKAQYIAHKIFKKNGLIRKYISHSALNHLSEKEMSFLKFQMEYPWRFSFSRITANPATDFFEMYDILNGETYLLFSPSITDILQTQKPLLWFNMISFNGECMQSYGPIIHFNGFETLDIVYYARLIHDEWYSSGEEVLEAIEEDPLPFSMLITGCTIPIVVHDKYQIVIHFSEYEVDEEYNSELFRDNFIIEYNHGVYKLSPKGWSEYPHLSAAFYKEEDQLLSIYSMTDEGYRALVDLLNDLGYDLEYAPDDRVNLAMQTTASKILKTELQLNPYDSLFDIDATPEDQNNLDNMNDMLGELIPFINAGKKPDLKAIAAKYCVHLEDVKQMYEIIKKKVQG